MTSLDEMVFTPVCDHHDLPLVNGWHELVDPEGWEAEQRIPCPLVPTVPSPRRHKHVWYRTPEGFVCIAHNPPVVRDETKARRGKQSRNYGNRAELAVARKYGGRKVGHAGGPVDVRGAEFNVQVKTHRRMPPLEWRKAFQGMEASGSRIPRLLLRFLPGVGLPPDDYFVIRADDWLRWFGRDD